MEGMLKSGNISGKIVCPNEKCGTKIGNFDWAGVQCGCKEWVTPVSFVIDAVGLAWQSGADRSYRASVSPEARLMKSGERR